MLRTVLCEGFSDACMTTASPGHQQQASEKRQGTKSRYTARGIARFMPSNELRRMGLEREFSHTVCKTSREDRPKLKSA